MVSRRFLLTALAGATLAACKGNNLVSIPHQVDTFTQSAKDIKTVSLVQRPGLIDILFVVNNAPSMCVKSERVAAAFSQFLSEIQSGGLDYHIGVVTTDLSDPRTAGALVKDGAGEAFLTPQTANAAAAFATIVSAIGTAGSPNSQPLLAAATALQEPLASGVNAGFLRPTAALAVIVVDDEDDFSLTLPPAAADGGPAPTDPVVGYFTRGFKAIKGVGNDALVSISAIAGAVPDTGADAGLPNPADCSAAMATTKSACIFVDNSAHAAARLFGVVAQTGGLGQSICEPTFDTILKNLGKLLVGLARTFAIANADQQLQFDPASVSVSVTPPGGSAQTIPDNAATGWTLDATTLTIQFNGSYVPPAGASIQIQYLQLQSQFKLTYPPVINSLVVQVNGATVASDGTDAAKGYHLDQLNQLIIFPAANLPPPGATITAAYDHP